MEVVIDARRARDARVYSCAPCRPGRGDHGPPQMRAALGCENRARRIRTARRRRRRPRRVRRPSRRFMSAQMAIFGDAPRVGAGSELNLTFGGHVVPRVDGLVGRDGEGVPRAPAPSRRPGGEGFERRNPFVVAEQRAARAATASTRRQYAAIYRSFGDWLRSELARPRVVGDLDGDVIAAYARYLQTA